MVKMTMLAATFFVFAGAATAQPVEERWFATGILQGQSRVLGPFKSLGECEDARQKQINTFRQLHETSSESLPRLSKELQSAAGKPGYREARDVFEMASAGVTVGNQMEDFWRTGAICDRH